MTNALKISEAASIAMHAITFVAANQGRLVSTKEIATKLKVSGAHLAKVLQWLVSASLICSIRGPRGGFELKRPAKKINLLQVYEAIDGRLTHANCLFSTAICGGESCIFGNLLDSVNARVKKYFGTTTISDVTAVYGKERKKRKVL